MTATALAPLSHHVEHVMGMPVSIDIRDAVAPPTAIAEVVDWLHYVDDTFSTHKEDSVISRLGRRELTAADTSLDVREVLALCDGLQADTDGAFNPYRVHAPNGTNFDPSGVVKGWAIERAAAILERHGCEQFCVNAGGDIALRGMAGLDTMWRIGIDHPVERHSLALLLETAGHVAIATSGTYARGAHIVDPRTDEPSIELVSATVIGHDLAVADAYATAVVVKGRSGLAWIDTKPGYEAYIIAADHQTAWTDGFNDYRASK